MEGNRGERQRSRSELSGGAMEVSGDEAREEWGARGVGSEGKEAGAELRGAERVDERLRVPLLCSLEGHQCEHDEKRDCDGPLGDDAIDEHTDHSPDQLRPHSVAPYPRPLFAAVGLRTRNVLMELDSCAARNTPQYSAVLRSAPNTHLRPTTRQS